MSTPRFDNWSVAGVAVVNGVVRRGPDFTRLDGGLVIEDGRIRLIASDDEVRDAAAARNLPVVDVGGATITAAFIDTHYHVWSTGFDSLGADLYGCRSIDEVLECLREAARDLGEGEWLLGARLDEGLIKEGRPPTAEELASVHNGPVMVNDRGLHYVLLNQTAWEALGVDLSVEGVYKENGVPTGRFQEHASGMVRERLSDVLPRDLRVEALREGMRIGMRRGIATVHAMEGGELFDDADALLLHEVASELPGRVVLYWCTADIEAARRLGLPRVGGDICLDGSIGSRTALFREPYADNPDDPENRGIQLLSVEEVVELVAAAERAEMQIGMHAIGEEAIETALQAFERVLDEGRTDLRHRIEHFGFPRPEHIERAAALGVTIPTQPAFAYLRGQPGGIYEQRLGPERARRGYPLRSLLDVGLLVAGGSDSNVTPADPLLGIQSCVMHPVESERISVAEAMELFTANGAKMAFEEDERGVLEAGMCADCVFLDRDPFEVPLDEIADVQVAATVVDGELAFCASSELVEG